MRLSGPFPVLNRIQSSGSPINPLNQNARKGLQRDMVSLSQRPTSVAQHPVQFAGNFMIKCKKLPPELKPFYIDVDSKDQTAMAKYNQDVSALYRELRPILENEYGSDIIAQYAVDSRPFYTSYLLMNVKPEDQDRMVGSIFRAKQNAGARLEPNIQWLKLPRTHNLPVQKIISFPSPSVAGKRIAIVLTDTFFTGGEFTLK